MFGVFVNVILILAGSILGLVLKNRVSQKMGAAVMAALSLCTVGIGISCFLQTKDSLCVIICMVLGTLLGEKLNIEKGIDRLGQFLRKKLTRGGGDDRFVEAFVTTTILYCVGAMAINGSIQAGLNGDCSILLSKSVMDGSSAISFAATMGVGVAFSALPILIYEGAIVLLAGVVGPYLGPAVITEMTAVGGAIIMGISYNMLNMTKEKLRVGNMLPAIFLPILYIPLLNWVGSLMG